MPGRIEIDDVAARGVRRDAIRPRRSSARWCRCRATVWREGHDAVAATLVVRYHGTAYPQLGQSPARRVKALEGTAVPIAGGGHPASRIKPQLHADVAGPHPGRVPRSVRPRHGSGLWTFRVDGWGDPITTWRHAVTAKLDAGQSETRAVQRPAGRRAAAGARRHRRAPRPCATPLLRRRGGAARAGRSVHPRGAALSARGHRRCSTQYPLRELVTRGDHVRRLGGPAAGPLQRLVRVVPAIHRRLGHRGQPGARHVRDGDARRCRGSPRWASTWSYLPPIHPIGKVHRKGRNNTVTAEPDDVGSPWAIGSDEGGHDAVHPDLGTIDDFDDFVAAARDERPGGGARPGAAVRAGPPVGQGPPPSGSPCCRTARSPTRRTRRRSTRTSIRSTSTTIRPGCTTRCCGWCGTGSTTASRSSGSTTRTPSRRTSGPG